MDQLEILLYYLKTVPKIVFYDKIVSSFKNFGNIIKGSRKKNYILIAEMSVAGGGGAGGFG